jgi:chloramphenicol O-acetyltransferase type B
MVHLGWQNVWAGPFALLFWSESRDLMHILDALRKLVKQPSIRRRLREIDIKLPDVLLRKARLRMTIEEGASIARGSFSCSELSVGAHSYLRSGCELINVKSIGRFCSIGNNVIIGQERTGHPLDWVSTHPFQHIDGYTLYSHQNLPAVVENDVWIGRDAIIMEGVRLGTGCVVGARSVVTKDVPPYAIVAGVPARFIRLRHTEALVAELLESCWWERSLDVLERLPTNSPHEFLRELMLLPPPEVSPYRCISIADGRLTANNWTKSR